MSEAEERMTRFLAWAEGNRPSLRAQDRKRVASELFEMVGDEVVLELDVEGLQKRYRDGLLGAQAVMLVMRVGRDVLAWQEHELARSKRQAAGIPEEEPPEEDDYEHSSDPSSRPPPSARAWARKRSDRPSARRALEAPRVPGDLGVDADGASGKNAIGQGEAVESESRDARESDRPPKRRKIEEEDRELDEDEREVISRWTFEEEAAPRSRQGGEPEMRPSEPNPPLEPTRDEREPQSRSSEPRLSSRPMPELSGPASATSSFEGIASSKKRQAVVSLPAATDKPRGPSRRTIAIAGAALAAIVLALVLYRALVGRDEPTAGLFISKHLKVGVSFPSGWVHAGRLDDGEKTDNGWERRVSVFYEGASATDFTRQLTIVALDHATAATMGDVRSLGTAELLSPGSQSRCVPLPEGREGFRCESSSVRGGRQLAILEEFFLVGTEVVFARGMASPTEPSGASSGSAAMPEGSSSIDDMASIIASIEPLDSK